MQRGIVHIAVALVVILLSITVGIVLCRITPNVLEKFGTADESAIWEKRVASALQVSDCEPTTGLTFGEPYYKGSLIDTHYHIPHLFEEPPDSNFDNYVAAEGEQPSLGKNVVVADIVCALKQESTLKAFAFFPVYPDSDGQDVMLTRKVMERYPDKFVPFIMPPDSDNDPGGSPTVAAAVLSDMLSIKPGLFNGYGEIGLYKRKGGAKELPPDSERLQEIYPVIKKHKLIVYFHLGEGQKASFEKILAQNRDINFIFHGDQLVSYENGDQNLQDIEDILSNHPNAYYGIDELYGDVWLLRPDVSKRTFMNHFKNYEELLAKDLATWKDFIKRHPDQVLWGTDRGGIALWTMDTDVGVTLANYARAFIGRLDTSVQERFAYKNAQKLVEMSIQ